MIGYVVDRWLHALSGRNSGQGGRRRCIVSGREQYTEQFWDLYPFLVRNYNVDYQGCTEYLSAAAADLVDSQILHISPGTPLLNSRRIAACNLGPLEYAVLRIRTDLMELCITMGPSVWPDTLN